MQREVVNVAYLIELIDIVEAGGDRCDHAMALGKFGNHRIVLAHAVRAVQPYDLRPLSRAIDLDVAGTKELQDFTLKHGCASFGSRAKRRRPADVAERVPRPPFVLPLVEPV